MAKLPTLEGLIEEMWSEYKACPKDQTALRQRMREQLIRLGGLDKALGVEHEAVHLARAEGVLKEIISRRTVPSLGDLVSGVGVEVEELADV